MNLKKLASAGAACLLCGFSVAAAAQSVATFTVVNADTNTDIATFTSSGTISIAVTPRINVRANASGVGSVSFRDATSTKVESVAPYAYKGDTNGIYNKWAPAVGSYVINATPYTGTNASGTAGPVATLTLTITNTSPPPPPPTTNTGNLIIDPYNAHFFVYDRDSDGDGNRDPAYLAGVGGPEGFLYETATRKQLIINRLKSSSSMATPVNGIYFHSIRAFGGDGNSFETPFNNDADPNSGLSTAKLDDWMGYLQQMDNAGIIMWFTLLDDHAIPYGCAFSSQYDTYARGIVSKFKNLRNLIWVTQEEYRWTDNGCTLAQNDDRQVKLAQSIRAVDAVHAIATHHMNGASMVFPNDPNIKVFGQQSNASSPAQMHDKSGLQGWGGNWVYVMAEDHPWHMNLIDAELASGTGRAPMRKSHWATAMSGGYVLMYNSFECNNSAKLCNDGPTDSDPTDGMLDDLRRLRLFMESTPFNRMTPLFDDSVNNNFALTNAKLDGTDYILSNASAGQYILYGAVSTTKLGVRGAPAGNYSLKWYDPLTGATSVQSATVGTDGMASFSKPAGFGVEVALFAKKL